MRPYAARVSDWLRSSYCADGQCVEVKWVKSSFSTSGACVEAAWMRSPACSESACVEAAPVDDEVWVRDSKNPDGPSLRFTRAEWTAFLDGVAAGEFRFR